jgi:predicted Zn-dependent peptidase
VVSDQLKALPSLVDNAEAFQRAQRILHTSVLSSFETNEGTARVLTHRALAKNSSSGVDLLSEYDKEIHALTPAVVKQVAAKLVSNPLTLIGAGDVTLLPNVRQLKA